MCSLETYTIYTREHDSESDQFRGSVNTLDIVENLVGYYLADRGVEEVTVIRTYIPIGPDSEN